MATATHEEMEDDSMEDVSWSCLVKGVFAGSCQRAACNNGAPG